MLCNECLHLPKVLRKDESFINLHCAAKNESRSIINYKLYNSHRRRNHLKFIIPFFGGHPIYNVPSYRSSFTPVILFPFFFSYDPTHCAFLFYRLPFFQGSVHTLYIFEALSRHLRFFPHFSRFVTFSFAFHIEGFLRKRS